MKQRKKAGDKGAGLLPWVQGLAPASPAAGDHVAIRMPGEVARDRLVARG